MSVSLSRAVLRWMHGMKVECRAGFRSEVRTRSPERNVAEMECIYRKHMAIKLGMYLFSATTKGWWGLRFLYWRKPKLAPIRCNKLTALPLGD